MARPYRAVLRLSPLEQRIRDRRTDLYWELEGIKRVGLSLAEAERTDDREQDAFAAKEMAIHLAKASELAAGLVELVKQREVPNG